MNTLFFPPDSFSIYNTRSFIQWPNHSTYLSPTNYGQRNRDYSIQEPSKSVGCKKKVSMYLQIIIRVHLLCSILSFHDFIDSFAVVARKLISGCGCQEMSLTCNHSFMHFINLYTLLLTCKQIIYLYIYKRLKLHFYLKQLLNSADCPICDMCLMIIYNFSNLSVFRILAKNCTNFH
jgi:hypothetical protein